MNVLLIGGGGREHALAWAIAKSPLLGRLWCAPGNAGIAEVAEIAALDVGDHQAVAVFCKENGVGLVVVGPEAPLVAGIADDLAAEGISVFGSSAAASRLEGSKAFTKELCDRAGIATAAYGRFDKAEVAKAYIRAHGAPIVVKADGLAAGKGVIIAETVEEAEAAIDDILGGMFGSAGAEVVVEEFLDGEEASFFALCDGETTLPLAGAQDYKRAGDGDTGPNTGGMGAYSPGPVLDDAMAQKVMADIIAPTLAEMKKTGCPFTGVLFAGLMIKDGVPKLLEYNVRFGDPECQVLMARLDSDLLALLKAAADGGLAGRDVRWKSDTALTVVMAAKGYPGSYDKGTEIRGIKEAGGSDCIVFHAGTSRDGDRLLATGGRVLCVTGLGADVAGAQARAYQGIDAIDWPGGFCRTDIGWRAVKRETIDG